MIVVADTTPLISLLKINRLELLERLFGEVMIPKAVFDELTVDKRFRTEADQIRQESFIVVKPVNNQESASVLKRATGLDQGESEAIVLTDELEADLLLMDEALSTICLLRVKKLRFTYYSRNTNCMERILRRESYKVR